MNKLIYLDHNATTPLDPEVVSEMKPMLEEIFGNPSSLYKYGAEARTVVEKARARVAGLLGCKNHEVIFTSGGSESNNTAIKGIAFSHSGQGNHIITSQVEHPAVKEVCRYLETKGFRVTYLPVNGSGIVDMDALESAISKDTILITVMHANNETGVIQPIKEMVRIAHQKSILFHTDAAQSAGKIPLTGLGADLISLAAHKLYGPKGVGALYVREGLKLEKLIHGADHEQDRRAGTENVISIAGFGKACEVASRDLEVNGKRMKESRDLLFELLERGLSGLRLNGDPERRLPNTLNVSFKGLEANLLLSEISERIAASAGAACHSAGVTVSETLEAMGIPLDYAMGTVRFSTGKHTTIQEVEEAATLIIDSVNKLRGRSDQPENTGKFQLTHFTQGLGCACKLRPQVLEEVMTRINHSFGPDILVGPEHFDDSAVVRIQGGTGLVQTVDFFTPVVDDPFDFGAIAAANSFSDIYAMGGIPLYALNIVGFPSSRLPVQILHEILKGAEDKAREAGVQIIGGHTVDDVEPKFGMAVTGTIDPDKVIRNNTAKPGDVLVLTKPIGTGILSTALKRGLANAKISETLVKTMKELNMIAAETMARFSVSACTDVSGFGLLGHLKEMSVGSGVDMAIDSLKVPLLPGTEEMALAGAIPGGTRSNLEYISKYVLWDEEVPEIRRLILCDAQTSGGLIISIKAEMAEAFIRELEEAGINASVIGEVTARGEGLITVTV